MIELDGMRDDEIKLTLLKLLPHGHPDMGEMPIMFFRIRLLDHTWIGNCDLRLGDSRSKPSGNYFRKTDYSLFRSSRRFLGRDDLVFR